MMLLKNVPSSILLCLISSPIDVEEDEAIDEAIKQSFRRVCAVPTGFKV